MTCTSAACEATQVLDLKRLLARRNRGRSVRVAVIDSGWDRRIGDARVLPGIGLVDRERPFVATISADDQDVVGHGTACADLVLRVAPGCEILPIRVFGDSHETSPEIVVEAIQLAADAGAQVINLSLSTPRRDALPALHEACRRATAAGSVIVGASANRRGAGYPAAFDCVIGVARWREATSWRCGFRYHEGAACECSAAGTHVRVRHLEGRRRTVGGTSFAAPVVAGHVAVLLSASPGLSLSQLRMLLAAVAVSIDCRS